MVSADITKAFDSIDISKLLQVRLVVRCGGFEKGLGWVGRRLCNVGLVRAWCALSEDTKASLVKPDASCRSRWPELPVAGGDSGADCT